MIAKQPGGSQLTPIITSVLGTRKVLQPDELPEKSLNCFWKALGFYDISLLRLLLLSMNRLLTGIPRTSENLRRSRNRETDVGPSHSVSTGGSCSSSSNPTSLTD